MGPSVEPWQVVLSPQLNHPMPPAKRLVRPFRAAFLRAGMCLDHPRPLSKSSPMLSVFLSVCILVSDSQLYDVIVVGMRQRNVHDAGLGRLARRGVRVAIVERANFPARRFAAISLEPAGLPNSASHGNSRGARGLDVLSDHPPRGSISGPVSAFAVHSLLSAGAWAAASRLHHTASRPRPPPLWNRPSMPRQSLCSAALRADRGARRRFTSMSRARTSTCTSVELIVGADGASPSCARSFNLEMADRAHISIAQRRVEASRSGKAKPRSGSTGHCPRIWPGCRQCPAAGPCRHWHPERSCHRRAGPFGAQRIRGDDRAAQDPASRLHGSS